MQALQKRSRSNSEREAKGMRGWLSRFVVHSLSGRVQATKAGGASREVKVVALNQIGASPAGETL
jgi:hypothetical protein